MPFYTTLQSVAPRRRIFPRTNLVFYCSYRGGTMPTVLITKDNVVGEFSGENVALEVSRTDVAASLFCNDAIVDLPRRTGRLFPRKEGSPLPPFLDEIESNFRETPDPPHLVRNSLRDIRIEI